MIAEITTGDVMVVFLAWFAFVVSPCLAVLWWVSREDDDDAR